MKRKRRMRAKISLNPLALVEAAHVKDSPQAGSSRFPCNNGLPTVFECRDHLVE